MNLKITARDKNFLIAGGAALGLYLLIVLVAQPIYAAQKRADQQIQTKIEFIKKYYEILNQKPYYESKNRVNQQTRAALSRKFLSENNTSLATAGLQKILEGFARQSGVTVERVRVEKTKTLQQVPAVPIELTLRSNLRNLTQFVFRLENFEKFLLVEEIVTRRINKADPEELQTRILVTGFIKPTDTAAPHKI